MAVDAAAYTAEGMAGGGRGLTGDREVDGKKMTATKRALLGGCKSGKRATKKDVFFVQLAQR